MSGNTSTGIRSTLTKVILRAGLERWLKPFPTPRASRQAELEESITLDSLTRPGPKIGKSSAPETRARR
jgi:hypothetical protein